MSTENRDALYIAKQKDSMQQKLSNYTRNLKKFGKHIDKKRTEYDISYTEIGNVAGVSRDTISSFMQGKTAPHLIVVKEICVALEKIRKEKAKK